MATKLITFDLGDTLVHYPEPDWVAEQIAFESRLVLPENIFGEKTHFILNDTGVRFKSLRALRAASGDNTETTFAEALNLVLESYKINVPGVLKTLFIENKCIT